MTNSAAPDQLASSEANWPDSTLFANAGHDGHQQDQRYAPIGMTPWILSITARNKKEIEFLQGAFESYKSSLHQEMDDKWNRKKTDLTNELEQQKDKEIHEMSKYE